MLVVDAHLDLAMNAVMWNRDLALAAHETRRIEREEQMTEKGRAGGTVGFPDLRAGEIGLVFATVIARKNHGQNSSIDFRTHEIAFAQAQGQLAYYQELQRQGIIRQIRTRADLGVWRAAWEADPASARFGFVLLMEGADPIVAPEQTQLWWDDGLRMVGLAHYGPSAYAFGTGSAGPLTHKGRALLQEMDRLGMMLDVSHLTECGCWTGACRRTEKEGMNTRQSKEVVPKARENCIIWNRALTRSIGKTKKLVPSLGLPVEKLPR